MTSLTFALLHHNLITYSCFWRSGCVHYCTGMNRDCEPTAGFCLHLIC